MSVAGPAAAATPPALDVERIRRDFPILSRMVREHRLVYLDNAATTQKPRPVLDALARYYGDGNANIHRGVYTLSEEATAAYDAARVKVQRFVNARASRENRLHAQLHREHQPRGAQLRPAAGGAGGRDRHHPHGAPLQHRALAAPVRAGGGRSFAWRRSTTAARCSSTSSSG